MGWRVLFCFFPLPQFWLLVLSKTAVTTGWPGWGLVGPSCVVFMLSDLKNASGSASPPSHTTESSSGSLPPSRLPAGRLRLSRVTPFILLRSVARYFPLANRISLVGRAGRGGQTFQRSVLERGAKSLLPGFEGRQLSYSSCPLPFLLFSLLCS